VTRKYAEFCVLNFFSPQDSLQLGQRKSSALDTPRIPEIRESGRNAIGANEV